MLVLQFLASFSCVNAHYLLQTKRREFLLCYSYKNESLWMSIQPIEVPDRQIDVFPTKLLVGRGQGQEGVQIKKELQGGEGTGPKKKSPDLRSPEVGISDDIICLNTICPLSCNYNSYFIIIPFFNNVLPQLQVLHETALIEAFNLKAGIEYQLKNCKLLVIFTGSLKVFVITEMSCVRLKINFKVIHPANFLWFV